MRRDQKEGKRDLFRKIVKKRRIRCTSAKLVRRIPRDNKANEWQQKAARGLLPVSRHSQETKACYQPAKAKNDAKTATHILHS